MVRENIKKICLSDYGVKVLNNMQNILGLEDYEIPKRGFGGSSSKHGKKPTGNYQGRGGQGGRQTNPNPQNNQKITSQDSQYPMREQGSYPMPAYYPHYPQYMYSPQYQQHMAYMSYGQSPLGYQQPSRNTMMTNRGSNFQVPMMVIPTQNMGMHESSQGQYYGGGVSMNVNLNVNLNYGQDQTSGNQPLSAGIPSQSNKRARMGSLQEGHHGLM